MLSRREWKAQLANNLDFDLMLSRQEWTLCLPPPLQREFRVRSEEDKGLPLPFEDLLQESEAAVPDKIANNFLKVESTDSGDDCSFPDARALLHVTSRRKVHRRKASSPTGKEMHIMTEDMEKESESFQGKISAEVGCLTENDSEHSSCGSDTALCQLGESALGPSNYAILQELEAISVLKLLQGQENMIASCMELAIKMQDVTFEVQHSSNTVEEISSVVEDLFQSFSDISKMFLEIKAVVSQDIEQFKFIADGHEKLHSFMKRKMDELEIEKHLLLQQTTDLQNQVQELKFEAQEREKTIAEVIHQHEPEKDELCRQILVLQKEVSCLSSSSLTKEKETLRKELEKTKSKLKDTEFKLKNTIQDKVRLESEKAHAEREIKHLHGQKAILERDVSKHDSLARHESKAFDFSKSKGHNVPASQTLQVDYEKLEIYAFEMEAEIASLEEKLIASVGEKNEAFARSDILEAELEALSNKLNTANSDIKLMEGDISSLTLRLDESEYLCQRVKTSHDLILREKEDMEMLTDALLEFETKKSTWLTMEKAFVESDEKSSKKIAMLTEKLLKVKGELESCQELCKKLRRKLSISQEHAETEREHRIAGSLEITRLMGDIEQLEISRLVCQDVLKSKIEELSWEHNNACEHVNRLQKQLKACQEKERTDSQLKMYTISDRPEDIEKQLSRARKNMEELSEKLFNMEVKTHNEALGNNIEKTKLRMRLRSTLAKLDAFQGRYKEAVDEMELMNKKFEVASTKLKEKLASYGIEILNLKKQLSSND